jgi:hypothetical protein
MGIGLTFSIVIVGVIILGLVLNMFLNNDGYNTDKSNRNMNMVDIRNMGNFSTMNIESSNKNLSNMSKSYSPYLSSSNTNTWSYGSYRG